MSTAQKVLLSPEEYLARERAADFKSEYCRGEMFAMAGASERHTRIKDNLAHFTANQLDGGPCRVYTSDLRVKVSATGLYTYPDVVFVCDEPRLEDRFGDTLLNPRVITEVLSKSTESYDRGEKFAQYRQLPSVKEYVLVSQDRPLVERFVRQPDDTWVLTEFSGSDKTFEFGTMAARVAMADIYRGVAFPETPER